MSLRVAQIEKELFLCYRALRDVERNIADEITHLLRYPEDMDEMLDGRRTLWRLIRKWRRLLARARGLEGR